MDLGTALVLKRSNHNLLDCIDTSFPEQPGTIFEEDLARRRKFPRQLQPPLVSGVPSAVPSDGLPPCSVIEFPDATTGAGEGGSRMGITQAHSAPWIPVLGPEALAGMPDLNSFDEREMDSFVSPEIPTSFSFDDDTPDTSRRLDRECHVCHKLIGCDGFVANGVYFHAACVQCAMCHSPLKGPRCAFMKDAILCCNCAVQRAPINHCRVCGLGCDGLDAIVARKETVDIIHAKCFNCYLCGKKMDYGTHTFVQGCYMCRSCDKVVRERVCAKCGELVVEGGAKMLGKWYHCEHFLCCECGCQLHGNCFVAHHNRPYCMKCGGLFRKMCAYCKKELDEEIESVVRWRKKKYHVDCFVCWMCGRKLVLPHVRGVHNRPHCLRCYEMRKQEGFGEPRHVVWKTNERRQNYEDELQEKFSYPQYTSEADKFLTVTVKREPRLALTKIPTTDDLRKDLTTKLLADTPE